jgi:hypothetical protein
MPNNFTELCVGLVISSDGELEYLEDGTAYHAFRRKEFFVLTLREVPDVAVRVPAKGLGRRVLIA